MGIKIDVKAEQMEKNYRWKLNTKRGGKISVE